MRNLVIEVPNEAGALAKVTQAISDAGVNLTAATCVLGGHSEHVADLHVLVKHSEATRRVLEPAGVKITEDREVVVVAVEDRPGVLADLAHRVAEAGISLDLLYVATNNRLVFGADDIGALRDALGVQEDATTGQVPVVEPEVEVATGSRL